MMKRDYKFLTDRPRSVAGALFRPGRRHLVLLAAAGLALGFFLSAAPDDAAATRSDRLRQSTADAVSQDLPLPGQKSDSPGVAVTTPSPATETLALRDAPEAPLTTGPAEALAEDPLLQGQASAGDSASVGETADQAQPEDFSGGDWQQFTVKSGDSLAQIFSRAGLTARQLYDVMQAEGPVSRLKRLFPGETLRVRVDDDGSLNELVLKIDPSHSLRITRNANGYQANKLERDYEVRTANASGVIAQSLFVSAQKAGMSDNLTMELAGIFGWDIDMAQDLREGDRFTVIYEQNYLDGRKVSDGDIIAAEFINRGKTYRAIRFIDSDGRSSYYTPSGLSVRKAFLRTPVNFTRISSKFDLHRMHPILNRIRAHKGVDYAAPTGTPVKATGDGKIVFRGRKGGYGNVIIIRHGSRYSTLYGHMSRFNSRFKLGSTVHQGQIIGYVGQTGLATGPHLHYEFRVNGVHRNPLTVDLPVATPIPTLELPAFRAEADPLIDQLDVLDRTQVARN